LSKERVAAQLSHPNIEPIYDLGSGDGRESIAMQVVEGSTLERRIHEGERLRTPRVLTLIAMISEGLAHAHQNGVIYWDVKPSNILCAQTNGRY
jgi:eukaryotic-like serine/threonine-protein kinase